MRSICVFIFLFCGCSTTSTSTVTDAGVDTTVDSLLVFDARNADVAIDMFRTDTVALFDGDIGDTTVDVGGDAVTDSALDTTNVIETCSDGIRNQDETEVDCGGGVCPSCSDCRMDVRSMDLACQRSRYERHIYSGQVCSNSVYAGRNENGTHYSANARQHGQDFGIAVIAREGYCFRYSTGSSNYGSLISTENHYSQISPVLYPFSPSSEERYLRINGNESFSHNTTALPAPGTPVQVLMVFRDSEVRFSLPSPAYPTSIAADPFYEDSTSLHVTLQYPSGRPEVPTMIVVRTSESVECVVDSSFDELSIPRSMLPTNLRERPLWVRAQGYEFAEVERDGCLYTAVLGGRRPFTRDDPRVDVPILTR